MTELHHYRHLESWKSQLKSQNHPRLRISGPRTKSRYLHSDFFFVNRNRAWWSWSVIVIGLVIGLVVVLCKTLGIIMKFECAVLSRMFLGPIKRLVSRTDWGQRIEYSLSLSKFHVENHMTSDRHSMWNQKAGNAGIRATSVADFSNDSSSGSPRAPIGIALIRFLPRQIAKVFHCGLEVLVNFLILRIDWPIVYGTQRVKISFQRLTNNRY